MRKLGYVVIAIALLLGLGWLFREPIILASVKVMMGAARGETAEYRPIDWQQAPAGSVKDDKRPNIVVIVADDLGWNDLTFNGGGVAGGTVPTPHIDSLARDGAWFRNGYSANGTCAPSRAAIMTGRYPTRFGFEFTPTPGPMMPVMAALPRPDTGLPPAVASSISGGKAYEEMGVPTEEITLAETLRDSGYHTVHIGKWHLGLEHGMAPHHQGFNESLLMSGILYMEEDDPGVVNAKQDFDPIDRFLWAVGGLGSRFNGGERFKPKGYLTDYYTEEAVKVIEANKDRPFFLYLAHWAPHTPLQASREDYDALSHIENHRLRVYAAMIRALDRGVGQVMQALKDNGLDDNTLVIFTSDNGGAGYIGLPGVNDPFRGWKITFFEGGIHVPYFIKWPGKVPSGTISDHPVHHFDIFATAAGAAGATMPSDRKMDGVNLLPYTQNAPIAAVPPHKALFWRGGHYQVVISDGWKMQRTERPKKTWLFHLAEDPTEQVNLADARPDQVAVMQALLDEWNAEQMDPAWPSLGEAAIAVDKHLEQMVDIDAGDEYIYWAN